MKSVCSEAIQIKPQSLPGFSGTRQICASGEGSIKSDKRQEVGAEKLFVKLIEESTIVQVLVPRIM